MEDYQPVPDKGERQNEVKDLGWIKDTGLERGKEWNTRILIGIPEWKFECLNHLYPEKPRWDEEDRKVPFDEDGFSTEKRVEIEKGE